MAPSALHGKTALITGASAGLGADFARQLAQMGCAVVLVARREEALRKLAQQLEHEPGVRVTVLPMDLSLPGAAQRLFALLDQQDLTIDVLVNNAGFGMHGPFAEQSVASIEQLLQLNVVFLTELSRLAIEGMRQRGSGHLLQVASIGAFQSTPSYAVYCASKAYVQSLGEALHHELGGSGVSCTVLSPGVTATEFLQVAGQRVTPYQRLMMMRSPDVVRCGLRAMLAGRPLCVPGLLNWIGAWSMRLLPRRLQAMVAAWMMRGG